MRAQSHLECQESGILKFSEILEIMEDLEPNDHSEASFNPSQDYRSDVSQVTSKACDDLELKQDLELYFPQRF